MKKSEFIFLLLLSIFTCFGVVSAADLGDSVEVYHEEGTFINPFYADLIESGEFDVPYNENPLLDSDASLDEAIVSKTQFHDKLLNEFKNFKPVITIVMYSKDTSITTDFLRSEWNKLMTHTGIPNEGDYLYFNYVRASWKSTRYSLRDNREYQYQGGSYKYRYEIRYETTFCHSMAQEIEVSNKINKAAASLKPKNNTDGAKIRAVYEYVINQVSLLDSSSANRYYSYSTHAALVGKKSLSCGYATLAYRLLLTLGVDNRISGNGANRWNIVNAGGTNYYMDAAFGDGKNVKDKYFLIGEKTLNALDNKSGAHTPASSVLARLGGIKVSATDYNGTEKPAIHVITPEPGVEPEVVEKLGIWMYNAETEEYENVTGKKVQLDVAGKQQIRFEVWDSNGKVPASWKSGSAKVASVNSDGIVTGWKTGNAKISANVSGVKKALTVTVQCVALVQPEKMWASGPDSVAEGKTVKMSFGFNQNPQPKNKNVTWISTDTSVATVNKNGVVKGVEKGYTTIRVCSVEDSTVCAAADIRVYPIVTAVKINDKDNETLTIDIGTTGYSYNNKNYEKLYYVLDAETEHKANDGLSPDASSQSVTWKTSSPKIASVDHTGLVKGLKVGNVTITATAVDGSKKSDKVKIKVISDVQPGSLHLTAGKVNDASKVIGGRKYIVPNGKVTLKASFEQSIAPTNKKVVWKSSNPDVLNVTSAGVVSPNIKWIVNNGGYSGTVYAYACPKEHSEYFDDGTNGIYCKSVKLNISLKAQSGAALKSANAFSDDALGFDNGAIAVDGAIAIDIFAEDDFDREKSAAIDTGNLVDNALVHADTEVKASEAEIMSSDETAEVSEIVSEESAETASSISDGPHFAADELYLNVGESAVLDVVNPDENAIIVGLSGNTEGVLWDQDLNILTSIGEAEVTAYLSTVDPVEIKDMLPIHIVAAAEETNAVETPENDAEDNVLDGTDSNVITDPTATEPDGSAESGVVETDEIDPAGTDEPTKDETILVEIVDPDGDEYIFTESEAAIAGDGQDGLFDEIIEDEHFAEPAQELNEAITLVITDLNAEGISGEEGTIVTIERGRFEVEDEILSRLVFETADESIARLTSSSAEEILQKGIEIELLASGETELIIKTDADEEALLRVRIAVSPIVKEDLPSADAAGDESLTDTENTAENTETLVDAGTDELVSVIDDTETITEDIPEISSDGEFIFEVIESAGE